MVATLHIELVELSPGVLEMRIWTDNPNVVQTRPLALEEVADLVARAETDYYSPLPADLVSFGQRLYEWLDGGERWLTLAIEEQANQATVLVLAIATPHRLAHLPWEVLHGVDGFLVHELNPAA